MTARRLDLADDEGSTLPLVAFFGMLALVVVLLVTAATSLYLEKKRLFTLADGAALVGAEAFEFDLGVPSASGPDPHDSRPQLHDGAVAAAVDEYLAAGPPPAFDELAVVAAYSDDGLSATVTLESSWHPPVVSLFVPEGLRVQATATARSVFG